MTIPGSLTVTGLTYNIPSVQRFDFNGGSSPWPNDPGFTFFTPVKNWVERESTTSFKLSYVQNHPVRVVNTIDAAFVNSLGRTVVVQVTFSGRRDGGIGGSRFGIFKGVDGATTSDNYYDIPLAYSVVTATDSSAISATAILAPGNWIMLGVTQNSGAGYNCIDGLAQFVVSG